MIAWGLCGRLCGLVQSIVRIVREPMASPWPFWMKVLISYSDVEAGAAVDLCRGLCRFVREICAASLAGLCEQAPAQSLFKEIACARRLECCVFKAIDCARVVRFFHCCFH